VQNVEPVGFIERYTSKVPFFHKLFLSRVENLELKVAIEMRDSEQFVLHKKPPTRAAAKIKF
jgi:hypothetical protein